MSLQMNPNPNPNSHIGCYRHSQTCTHRSNEIYAYKGMRRIDLRNFNLVASLVKFPNISAIALLLSIVCGVCARSTFLPLLHRFADLLCLQFSTFHRVSAWKLLCNKCWIEKIFDCVLNNVQIFIVNEANFWACDSTKDAAISCGAIACVFVCVQAAVCTHSLFV